jgi:hypothetical protein
MPLLVVVLVWLVLAWKGTGRPSRAAAALADPIVPAVLGRARLPDAETLRRGLGALPARAVRAAVEASYGAEIGRRAGRVWVAVDAHQLPYWGQGEKGKMKKGWSGAHGKRLRGYRLYVATDTETGQVLTFLLARGDARDAATLAVLAVRVRRLLGRRLAGVVADCGFTSHASVAAVRALRVPFVLGFARSPAVEARLAALSPQQRARLRRPGGGPIRLGACPWDPDLRLVAVGARTPGDTRGPWVYVTSLRSYGPERVIARYRRRSCAEQAIEEAKNGYDLDHLVATRLHPNRAAVGLRLLARNAALGLQIADAGGRPERLREAPAFRAAHVEGLGLCAVAARTVTVAPLAPTGPLPARIHLPWTRRTVRLAA